MDAHAIAYQALDWLGAQPQWAALLFIAFIAFIEYVVPPLPHDVVVIAGGILAARGLLDPVILLGVVTIGSMLGAITAWYLGKLAGTHKHIRAFVMRFISEASFARLGERFRKSGRLVLAGNRFLPGVRSTIMFAAGIFRVRVSDIAIFGAFSAFLWNGLLIGAGVLLGQNLDQVISWLERYSLVAWGVVALVLVVIVARLWHARRRHMHAPTTPRTAG